MTFWRSMFILMFENCPLYILNFTFKKPEPLKNSSTEILVCTNYFIEQTLGKIFKQFKNSVSNQRKTIRENSSVGTKQAPNWLSFIDMQITLEEINIIALVRLVEH